MGRRTKEQTKVDETIIRKNAGGEGNETKLAFATRLNDLIDQQVLRQSDLSKMTGIATGTISGYRNGDKEPTITNLRKLAQALDVSADYLIGLSNVRSPNIDTQAICQKIGCSEDVVNNLTNLYIECKKADKKSDGIYRSAISLLNKYLSYPNTLEFLMYVKIVSDEKVDLALYTGGRQGEKEWIESEKEIAKENADSFQLYLLDKFSITRYGEQGDAFSWRAQQQFYVLIDYLTELENETSNKLSILRLNGLKIEALQNQLCDRIAKIQDHENKSEMINEYLIEGVKRIQEIQKSSSIENKIALQSDMIAWIEAVIKNIEKD